jgi:hypothetical protein
MLVEVAMEGAVVHNVVVDVTVEVVLPEVVVVSVDNVVLLALWLLGGWLGGSLWSCLSWVLWLLRWGGVLGLGGVVLWSRMGRLSSVMSSNSMSWSSVGVVVDLVVVSVLRGVEWLLARVVVGLGSVVHWVVESVVVWVVSIVVVLHPLVGVHKLVLVVIEGVVVLILLESSVLEVVGVVAVVIAEVIMMVVAVVSLEVVGTSVGVKVWHVVVLVDDVGVGVSVVVGPGLSVVAIAVVSPVGVTIMAVTVAVAVVSVITVVVSIVAVISWGKVGVVVRRLVSVVLIVEGIVVGRVSISMLIAVPVTVVLGSLVAVWMVGVSVMRVNNIVMHIGLDSVALLLVASKLMGHSVSWVVVVSWVRTNIKVVMVIEVNLGAVVVRLHVDIMSHGVVLSLVDVRMMISVVAVVTPVIAVMGIMSPDIVANGMRVMDSSVKKVMNTMGSVVSTWVMDWRVIMVVSVVVFMECI